MPAIDRAAFAKLCARRAADFGVSPHYLLAIAQLATKINSDKVGDRFGPYGVTQTVWDAIGPEPDLEEAFIPDDIKSVSRQITWAALKTYRAQKELLGGDPKEKGELPSAEQLYAKWPNDDELKPKLGDALTNTAPLVDPGIEAALGPVETHADSGMPDGTVGTLTKEEWQKYCNILGHMESSNRYNVVNPFGYAGRWQFGAEALQGEGYVKAGFTTKGMASPTAWVGKNGVTSLQKWLASKPDQDAAMQSYTQKHFKALVAKGAFNAGPPGSAASPAGRVAGFLAAAHLKGLKNAVKLLAGIATTDANGTSTATYFRKLSQAFGGPASP